LATEGFRNPDIRGGIPDGRKAGEK
jgi:hypothetical protein